MDHENCPDSPLVIALRESITRKEKRNEYGKYDWFTKVSIWNRLGAITRI